MDWKVSFVPNDTSDLTKRDMDAKINPKIVLTVRVGKGLVGAGMPILLEDLSFTGNMRLKFKFYNEFPHIKTIEASFLEVPEIDYSLKPVGGETFGFDINMVRNKPCHGRQQQRLCTDFLSSIDPWFGTLH